MILSNSQYLEAQYFLSYTEFLIGLEKLQTSSQQLGTKLNRKRA